MNVKNIVLIGAGNLATNLAVALHDKGYRILQVFSRTEESAKMLAQKVNAQFTHRLEDVITDADLYVVALKDDVIPEVLDQLQLENSFVVHTAGSVPMELLSEYTNQFGVFYPLQTFSKKRLVDFSAIPICLEANSRENLDKLEAVARELSGEIHFLNSEQRLYLHVSAVFACNFTNFMFASAESVLNKNDIPFRILLPLIRETFDKAAKSSPSEVQTGPAVRKDKKTIDKHLKLLSDSDLLQNLYRFVSDAIITYYRNKQK
jgi:predicted short-subunit dehydrogenase-like oxidoreductase (DUF2520 family)